ncbi:MAG: type II secretion system protein [Candidatus Gracilibacteria bacterium]|nr:type II secretion system protein [Candidatus Gracilibacteria bacterium]
MKTLFSSEISVSKIKNCNAFTLIELVVSITILSVIMLSVFMIYSNLIQINKRLEALRIVQENIRNITEQIASDVREKGIDVKYYDNSTPEKINNYTGSGNSVLAIQGGNRYYPMKDSLSGPVLCTDADQKDPNIHCYIGKEDSLNRRKSISDDRVRIESVRFFLSGDTGESLTNLSQEGKVTIVLSLGIENKVGISSEIAKNTHMLMETTISEKAYKKNITSTP